MNPKSNIYANLKAFAELKRNVFDLSQRNKYSQKCAEIMPIRCIHTLPRDYMEIKVSDKTLSFPLNTAAMIAGRKEIAAYFTPYNDVFSLFNQLQASRPDPKSSALVLSNNASEPRISLMALFETVIWQWYGYMLGTKFLPWYGSVGSFGDHDHTKTLLDAFDDFELRDDATNLGWQDMVYNNTHIAFPAYQYSLENFSIPGAAYEDTVRNCCKDLLGRWRVYNWVRKLEMLGYSSLYPIFDQADKAIDVILSENTSIDNLNTVNNAISEIIKRVVQSVNRLCEGNIHWRVNIYPIVAYNKIFYENYRNTYYDLDYYPHDYNLDFAALNEESYDLQIQDFSFRFLDIEYHQWKKDILTGALPDSQFGAVSQLTMPVTYNPFNTQRNNDYKTLAGQVLPIDGNVSYDNGKLQVDDAGMKNLYHTHTVSIPYSETSFDVLALKRAEMLQEYRQVLMRNGNRTSDIFKGLYGDTPASENENYSRFVDAFGGDIFVDTVVSTSDTSSDGSTKGALGDLGARCTIGAGGKFNFKTSDFGVLMFLTYIVPQQEYNAIGLDPALRALDPESHMIPFFQNLGFEPITHCDFSLYIQNVKNGVAPFNVRGYAPSYYKFKQAVDLVHGALMSLPATTSFLGYRDASALSPNTIIQDDWFGSLSHWVSPRSGAQTSRTVTLDQFYINPHIWDNNFLQAVDDTQNTDQFICETYIGVKCTRILSKLGLPNF